MYITREYLNNNPNHIFVFGDNLLRKGKGGAAKLRDLPNTYGFITKKEPNRKSSSYYNVDEYEDVYLSEIMDLLNEALANPNKTYLISKVGSGLANKFGIFEKIIKPTIKRLLVLDNIQFLW